MENIHELSEKYKIYLKSHDYVSIFNNTKIFTGSVNIHTS